MNISLLDVGVTVFVLSFLFSFFGARAVDRLWVLLYYRLLPGLAQRRFIGLLVRWMDWERRLKHLYVFWCDSPESEALASSLLVNRKINGRCLFVLSSDLWHRKEHYAVLSERLSALGCHVVWEDFHRVSTWYERAGRHFFLGANETENTGLARGLVAAAKEKGVAELELYVRGKIPKEIGGISIHQIEPADFAARSFLNANPVPTGETRFLIVGFGTIGEAVLKQHFIRGAGPGLSARIEIVDGDADAFVVFQIFHPAVFAEEKTAPVFHHLTSGSAAFFTWIKDNAARFDRIVVCLPQDEGGIDLAEGIARLCGIQSDRNSATQIFAYDEQNDPIRRHSPVRIFGKIAEVYTRDIVVDGLRIKHLPEMFLATMADYDRTNYTKTFCHVAADALLDEVRRHGFRLVKKNEGDARAATALTDAVNSHPTETAAAFGAARRRFLRWKNLPEETFAATDALFAQEFFRVLQLDRIGVLREGEPQHV